MVISNTSPLNYLVLIDQVHLLSALYDRVLIPRSVYQELTAPETPEVVRSWVTSAPQWLEVSAFAAAHPVMTELHAGERDAIALAEDLRADAVIIDERAGRREAENRQLVVIGTLGVIVMAHERGLVDLSEAIDRLRRTTFHASPKLLATILRRL